MHRGDLGPEIVASAPPITVRGGHCHFLGGVADGPQELRAAVRERAKRGCEVVKVMVSGGQLTPGSASHESQYDLADLCSSRGARPRDEHSGARTLPGLGRQ